MRSSIRELFIKEDYEGAVLECKRLLQDENDDPQLWYSLFLAENDNYININYDSLNMEIAFNKALELASPKEKKEFISEYNFYKNISSIPYMRQLYRYAQFEMGDEAIKVIEKMDREKHQLLLDDKDGFYEFLYQAVSQTKREDILNINAMITKLLYLITGDEECKEIVKKLYNLAADLGNANSAYELAKIYEEEGEASLAAKYFNMAADGNESDVSTKLKIAEELKYSNNENDKNKAFDIFYDSIDYEEMQCRAGLAYCYYFGVGTSINYDKALREAKFVIREIEENKDLVIPDFSVDTVYRIAGLYYKHDFNRNRDLNLAVKYLTVSAKNNWYSTALLVECLLELKRYNEARKYIDDLKDNNRPEGYYFEGYCYLYELGVSKNLLSAYNMAKKSIQIKEYGDSYALLYILANMDSQFDPNNEKQKFMDKANELGSQLMFRYGSAAVLQSNTEDKKLFLDFLKNNYSLSEPNTLVALADYYYDYEKDYRLATYYYEIMLNTAKKDYAAYSLGFMHEKGFYLEQSNKRAIEYYKMSNLQEAKDGIRRLNHGSTVSKAQPVKEKTSKPKKEKASGWWSVATIFFFQWMWIVMIVYLFKDTKVSKKIFKTYLFVILAIIAIAVIATYIMGNQVV